MLTLVRGCPINVAQEKMRIRGSHSLWNSCYDTSVDDFVCEYVDEERRTEKVRSGGDSTRFDCRSPPLNTAFRLVSRQVNEEALDVIFGENKFVLRTSRPDVLEGLLILGSKPLSRIRHLHIDLESPDETTGLRLDGLGDRTLIKTWETVSKVLASLVVPWRLDLTFTCTPADVSTATYLVDTLRRFPPLKHCSLSFGRFIDPSFRASVQELCLELSDIETRPPHSFPFSRLPPELRLHVLEYTDLVVKSEDTANWTTEFQIEDSRLCSQHSCCTYCCAMLYNCCCVTVPNAFSISCRCTPNPTSLLRVSRQMYSDASKILYRDNRFRLIGSSTTNMKFLKGLSSRVLELMNDVVLEVGELELVEWYEDPFGVINSWRDLLEFIRRHFTLSALKLTIHVTVSEFGGDWSDLPEEWDDHRPFYRGILNPVRSLKGLKAYLVYLQTNSPSDLEREAEKEVMGEEYDSAGHGKVAFEDRSWSATAYW